MSETGAGPFEALDRLRREHNGIFGVRVFLGHDGHNVVTLHDYDRELARGESGRSLTEAARRAERAWRLGGFWSFHGPATIAEVAAARYGPVSQAVAWANDHAADLVPGLFSTACVQSHVKDETGWDMTGDEVAERLEVCPRIVRLQGGCHWLLLPAGLERLTAGG